MTLKVVFRPAARAEFDGAALWYEDRKPGLGAQFVSEIERAVELASSHPERFPVKHGEIRCVQARRFPYSVFYRAEEDRIVVLAVFHARRDPAIWRARTRSD
jgi:plasmid stabilization system protein ParE